MTRDEFNEWYDTLKIAVPSLWQWAESLPDTRSTLETWHREVFSDLELEDCLEVTRLLVIGELDKPYGSDIPAFYRKRARQFAWERRKAAENAGKPQVPEDDPNDCRGAWDAVTGKGPMGRGYRKAMAIVAEEKQRGKSREEAIWIMKHDRRHEWVEAMEAPR